MALLGLALLGYGVARAGPVSAHYSVYADGLNNPRGLAFDDRGVLYVAEAGSGGTREVRGSGNEVFHVGSSGRVSRIPRAGQRETLDQDLPSVFSDTHRDYLGPAAVAVIGDDVYVLSCTGWSGEPGYDSTIVRYRPDGSKTTIADYSQLSIDNPSLARRSDPRADVPGGVPFGMIALGGKLYTTDGNLEFVQEFGPDGQPLRRLLEYPLSNRVLTGLTVGPDGALYLAEMGFWPYPAGGGRVTRLTLDGQASPTAGGVTASIAAAFGRDGSLYVLEHSAPLRQVHNVGRLVRIGPDGQPEVVLEPLDLPTALVTGPDGDLYVSDGGNRGRPGGSRILRVEIAEASSFRSLLDRAGALGAAGLGGLAALVMASLGALGLRRADQR